MTDLIWCIPLFWIYIGVEDITVNRKPKTGDPAVYEYKVSQTMIDNLLWVNGKAHLEEDHLRFEPKKGKRSNYRQIIRYEDIEEVYPNSYIFFIPVRRFMSVAVTVSLKNGLKTRFEMTKRRLFVKSLQERIEAWNKTQSQADG